MGRPCGERPGRIVGRSGDMLRRASSIGQSEAKRDAGKPGSRLPESRGGS
jgi:hypothetical protein